jgi:hypothetical protein
MNPLPTWTQLPAPGVVQPDVDNPNDWVIATPVPRNNPHWEENNKRPMIEWWEPAFSRSQLTQQQRDNTMKLMDKALKAGHFKYFSHMIVT